MARLDFTATNILTASELDELARQAISNVVAAGKPTGTAEGEMIAVTDEDRHYWWDGSDWIPGTWWKPTGRIWVSADDASAGALADGVSGAIPWTVITDPDGFYTAYDGTNYNFTIPASSIYDGLYAITVRAKWVGAWTPAPGDLLEILVNTTIVYAFPGAASAAVFTATIPAIPLTSGDTVAVRITQESGSSQTISTVEFTMVRIGA